MELVNNAPTESGAEATAYADAGITWGVTPNMQFDTGTNIGLTRASDDVRFFSEFRIDIDPNSAFRA